MYRTVSNPTTINKMNIGNVSANSTAETAERDLVKAIKTRGSRKNIDSLMSAA
jgi:hypothetical protein